MKKDASPEFKEELLRMVEIANGRSKPQFPLQQFSNRSSQRLHDLARHDVLRAWGLQNDLWHDGGGVWVGAGEAGHWCWSNLGLHGTGKG